MDPRVEVWSVRFGTIPGAETSPQYSVTYAIFDGPVPDREGTVWIGRSLSVMGVTLSSAATISLRNCRAEGVICAPEARMSGPPGLP